MRLEVDKGKCTGLGICESIADDVFEVEDDGTLTIHSEDVTENDRNRIEQAVAQCPTAALRITA